MPKGTSVKTLEKVALRDERGVATNGEVVFSSHIGSTRLKKAGGSLVAVVPAAARDMLNLSEGQELEVKVEGTRITLEPVVERKAQRVIRPRYSLDELLAQGVAEGAPSDENDDWQNAAPAGREVW